MYWTCGRVGFDKKNVSSFVFLMSVKIVIVGSMDLYISSRLDTVSFGTLCFKSIEPVIASANVNSKPEQQQKTPAEKRRIDFRKIVHRQKLLPPINF